MREEEKIFAGKLFNNQCEELKAIKRRMHEVNRLANALPEWDPEREKLLRGAFGAIGKTFHFVGPAYINYGTHTFIGENFFANFNFTVMDDARVYIGDNVAIGPNVSLLATNHPLIAQERMGLDEEGRTKLAEYAGVGPKVADCIALFGFAKEGAGGSAAFEDFVYDTEKPACYI